jgi:hypothetical protein
MSSAYSRRVGVFDNDSREDRLDAVLDACLDKKELRSLSYVIAFCAYDIGAAEQTIIEILTTAFNASRVEDISPERHDDAIRYLLNLNFKKVIN